MTDATGCFSPLHRSCYTAHMGADGLDSLIHTDSLRDELQRCSGSRGDNMAEKTHELEGKGEKGEKGAGNARRFSLLLIPSRKDIRAPSPSACPCVSGSYIFCDTFCPYCVFLPARARLGGGRAHHGLIHIGYGAQKVRWIVPSG